RVHRQQDGRAQVTKEDVGDQTRQVLGAVRQLTLQRAASHLPVQPHAVPNRNRLAREGTGGRGFSPHVGDELAVLGCRSSQYHRPAAPRGAAWNLPRPVGGQLTCASSLFASLSPLPR